MIYRILNIRKFNLFSVKFSLQNEKVDFFLSFDISFCKYFTNILVNKNIIEKEVNNKMNLTKGHGYLRKSKAYGVVSAIAVTTALAVSSGNALADENTDTSVNTETTTELATQPKSTNDNDKFAESANQNTGVQPVTVDNSTVNNAVNEAKSAGVEVTQDSTVDKGTASDASKLENAKSEIASDQNKQVTEIKEATNQQKANNEAYEKAQAAIKANNDYVDNEVKKDSNITVTSNTSTTTDGSASANNAAATKATEVLASNKQTIEAYNNAKANHAELVKASEEVNKAVDSAIAEIPNGVTANTTKEVKTVTEVNNIKADNAKKIEAAKQADQANKEAQAAYEATKKASDSVNADAEKKINDLKALGSIVNVQTRKVTNESEANAIKSENDNAFNTVRAQQEEWRKKYNELASKTSTEGYAKETLLQAVNLTSPNPQAKHGTSAPGVEIVDTAHIFSNNGTSGYANILDSTGVFKYSNVGSGFSTDIVYTNLKGLTVTTSDGQVHEITRINRKFELINHGRTGLNEVYIPNDPTEGFIVGRNNGDNTYDDFMNFHVTDSYYYNVNGQEVKFEATPETPLVLTYSSLNNNPVGREGAHAINGKTVEINGSTVTNQPNGFAYSSGYNRVEEVGKLWDTTDSPYQYKGAILGYFTSGSEFTTDFIQYDGPEDSGGQTYWFAINTKVVTPVIEVAKNATIVNTSVDPVDGRRVAVDLVRTTTPEKPTATLEKLSETVNRTERANFHDYALNYKPTVLKTVTDTDNTNTDGKTVAKSSEQIYTLVHDNIYSNVKNGDTITIVDPLEAGAKANQAKTKETAEKNGWTVNYDEAKETYTFTSVYNGTKLKSPQIFWTPTYDKGFYDNTYKVLVNDYTAYSNTVTTYTPEPPKPTKQIVDTKGADINGATTFNKNVTFKLTTDYSSYTKTDASKEAIGKGFYILDDVEDGKFKVNDEGIKLTDTENKDVKELFEMYHVLSDDARTEAINAILEKSGLSPKGEFYLWVAKDPSSFYTNYVKQAKNITIDLPSELTVEDGVKVTNDFYQVDFGNPYLSNKVEVQTPNVKPEKMVVDAASRDAKDLNDSTVPLNTVLDYYLNGVTIPENHDTLTQYDIVDKLDTEHDRYTGNWKVIITSSNTTVKETTLDHEVKGEDGTIYKAGDKIPADTKYSYEITLTQDSKDAPKYVTVTYKDGEWKAVANPEFLKTVENKASFDMDAFVEVERIKSGDVYNEYTNIVNGKEMISNKVVTHTPEPPKPVTPPTTPTTPVTPKPSNPVRQESKTPAPAKTPATATEIALSALGFASTSVLSMFGLAKRKNEKE